VKLLGRSLIALTAPALRVTALRVTALRITALLVTVLLVANGQRAMAATSPPAGHNDVHHAAIIADYDTGEILYTQDAMVKRSPASLTKMMTLYLVFGALEDGRLTLAQRITVSQHAASMEPSKLGVPAGATISIQNAILSVVTKSANDMAAALAETIAGSEAAFAELMTKTAGEIGMTRTNFRNASGLPHPDHYSTARDMLVLSRAVISRFPGHYRLFATGAFEYGNMRYPNMNSFLRTFAGADGIKTGYTRAAGHCLAASAVRAGRRVVGVVLGGPSLAWTRNRMTGLVNAAFDGQPTAPKPSIRVARTSKPEVRTAPVRKEPVAQGSTSRQAIARSHTKITEPTKATPQRVAVKTAAASPSPPSAAKPKDVTRPKVVERPKSAAIAKAETLAARRKPAPAVLAHAAGISPAHGIQASQVKRGPVELAGQGAAPPNGKWMVRIGERPDMGAARRRADAVRALLPQSLQGLRLRLAPERSSVEIAAVNLDQNSAHSVCSQLQRGGVPCIVIAPGREVYVTQR
jgi:D-alanyl-D-alanine carboxypeptidase